MIIKLGERKFFTAKVYHDRKYGVAYRDILAAPMLTRDLFVVINLFVTA